MKNNLFNYTVFTDSGGKYRFNLKANNGEIILSSQGYKSKQGRSAGIDSVMQNSQNSSRFMSKRSKSQDYYFILKARNGKVIGTSEMYTTKASKDKGIASVMKYGGK